MTGDWGLGAGGWGVPRVQTTRVSRQHSREHGAGGAVAAHDGALDGGGQAGVGPVAGQEESRQGRCASAGRGGCPASSEKVARRSRMAVPRIEPRARRPRARRPTTRRCASATSSSFVRSTTSAAPLHTSDTCVRVPGATRRFSKAHWNERPGKPTNGVSSTARSNHRFTVTIGDAPIAIGVARHVRRVPPASRRRASRTACHGTLEIDRAAPRSARRARARPARARRRRRPWPGAPAITAAAVTLEEGHRRVHERVRQRLRRQHQRRVVWPWAEHAPDHFDERAGRGAVDRLVERRHRQRLPQQLHQAIGLPPAAQPVAHGHRLGLALRRAVERARQAEHRQPVAPGQRRPRQHAGHELQRRRQGRAAQLGLARPARSTMGTASVDCTRRRSRAPMRARYASVS